MNLCSRRQLPRTGSTNSQTDHDGTNGGRPSDGHSARWFGTDDARAPCRRDRGCRRRTRRSRRSCAEGHECGHRRARPAPRTRCQGFWMPAKCLLPCSAGRTYGAAFLARQLGQRAKRERPKRHGLGPGLLSGRSRRSKSIHCYRIDRISDRRRPVRIRSRIATTRCNAPKAKNWSRWYLSGT
jgi:hypothetical protein